MLFPNLSNLTSSVHYLSNQHPSQAQRNKYKSGVAFSAKKEKQEEEKRRRAERGEEEDEEDEEGEEGEGGEEEDEEEDLDGEGVAGALDGIAS